MAHGDRLKIFLAGTSFYQSYGGPAYSVSRLGAALAEEGLNVTLWAPDGSAVASSLIPKRSGLERLDGTLDAAFSRCGAPDIIHDNGIWLPHNHRLASMARKLGIPRVVSLRGMLEPKALQQKRHKKFVAWALYQRRDLARASLCHATAETEANHFQALNLGPPVEVIPNGVDLPDLQNLPPTSQHTPRKALYLGRLHPLKGLPLLIEAWRQLRPSGWVLEIAGPDEGGHLRELQQCVAEAQLDSAIRFTSETHGIQKSALYRSASLFILPTYSENFGMVVAEALAHEVPVITTRGAPWECLRDEGCGWWTEISVDGLREALREATSSAAERLSEMGRRGRIMVAGRFQWTPIARRVIEIYSELCLRRASESEAARAA